MNNLILVRGGGDIATGIIQKFFRCGFKILILETAKPTAIRRNVSLCEAVYDGISKVENMVCRKIKSLDEIIKCHEQEEIPLLVDEYGEMIKKLSPECLIDGTIAKKNLGTNRTMAKYTIGIGPGFIAGKDVDLVVETMRGHNLGRLIENGQAFPNTGIPGDICGKSHERVLKAPCDGMVEHLSSIGDILPTGENILKIGECYVQAPFKGTLRGLIREGFMAKKGLKIADIDPRLTVDVDTVSDKARCIGGAALEGYLYLKNKREKVILSTFL